MKTGPTGACNIAVEILWWANDSHLLSVGCWKEKSQAVGCWKKHVTTLEPVYWDAGNMICNIPLLLSSWCLLGRPMWL